MNAHASSSPSTVSPLRRRARIALRGALAGSCALLTSFLHADEMSALGYTEPYRLITLSAAETGVIAEVLVQEGDQVRKGQVLARLDTAVLCADLEIARAEANFASVRRERIAELSQQTRVTPEESEKAVTDLTIKQAQVRKIEAMIEVRTMRSPVDGVVTEIKRDPSESVSAASPHVLTVVQIDKLAANLFLPPSRVESLKAGDSADLLLVESQERVAATVDFVSPVTDAASGTVRVKFTIDNRRGNLRSGARCTLAPAPTATR